MLRKMGNDHGFVPDHVRHHHGAIDQVNCVDTSGASLGSLMTLSIGVLDTLHHMFLYRPLVHCRLAAVQGV